MAEDKTRFIDAEEEWRDETISYEDIVVKQMKRCVDILSKERVGGLVRTVITKSGAKETYVEDVREQIINSVETFRALLNTVIKDGGEAEKELHQIYEEIEEYKKKLGSQKTLIYGHGYVEINKLSQLRTDHPIMRRLKEYQAQKYREMFEILVVVYHENKIELQALTIE